MLVDIMTEQRFYSPLKIGLFVVTFAYFLFAVHSMFTLAWIGEWEGLPGSVSFGIFITDITGFVGVIFRFIASIIAVAGIILYFVKKGLPASTTMKILRWVLVFEAIYWLGLLTSGVWGFIPVSGLQFNVSFLITSGIPCSVSSIAIPISLFKLASKLNVNKSMSDVIKWGLIAGTIYIFVFWLNNAGMWIATLTSKGTEYLSTYLVNLLSFVITIYGLPVLAIFTAYFAGKSISIGTETLEKLNLRALGAIIVGLGLYFLWNYLTWIFFGGNYLWSDWYAWFLGHNLDLWLLTLPVIGLPLLFKRQNS
jgi:hypothetical protein